MELFFGGLGLGVLVMSGLQIMFWSTSQAAKWEKIEEELPKLLPGQRSIINDGPYRTGVYTPPMSDAIPDLPQQRIVPKPASKIKVLERAEKRLKKEMNVRCTCGSRLIVPGDALEKKIWYKHNRNGKPNCNKHYGFSCPACGKNQWWTNENDVMETVVTKEA